MKKLTSLMLGLALAFGTVAFAADEKPATTEKKETKKTKKVGKKVEEKPAAEAKK